MGRPDERLASFLILRRDNIGDLVCTTPLLDALRAVYPGARIAALVNTYNAPVLERNPSVDEVHAYEKLKHRTRSLPGHVLASARMYARLRAARFDRILVPVDSPQSRVMASRVRARGVLFGAKDAPASMHEVERTFALARALGVGAEPGPLRVVADARAAEVLRSKHGLAAPVAVHISARRPKQQWPLERYLELVRALGREREVMLLWAPGSKDDPRHPGDDEAARLIAERAPCKRVPTRTLPALIAALSLARTVVCPDGGAMHLAAGLGKPVVALFGDSPVERWRPWGVPHRIVRPDSQDLKDLPLAPVLDALAALGEVREP
jgi:ADP-heptose:LPS heptosyltransferase